MSNGSGWVVGGGIGVGVVALMLLTGREQALIIGIITGAVYSLVALGLVLVYKSSGVFNFAQGEFGTVAVFTLYLAHTSGLNYLLAILLALAVAALFGLAVEKVVVRPLFEAPRVTLLVATAGIALLAIGIQIWFGEPRLRAVDPATPELNRLTVLGIQISDQRFLILGTLVLMAALLAYFFSRTNLGLAVLAASQDATATNLVGISVRRLSSLVWMLAAVLGGLAGVLAAPISQFGPGFLTSGALIPGFTAAVIGGMNSLPGAFLGGIIVGVAQSASTAGGLEWLPGAQSVATFLLLVTVLTLRPQGLLGKAA